MAVAGDVRPSVSSAGPRPVRLRRGPGGHRRCAAEGPLLRHRPAPQRRLLRQGLPGRDHRGLPGRTCLSICPSWAGSPRASSTTIPSWPWRRYWETAGDSAPVPSPSCSPTTCSRTGAGALARATTRGRWRALGRLQSCSIRAVRPETTELQG